MTASTVIGDKTSPTRTLFLPLNPNHVMIFWEIIRSLQGEYCVLCHDRISDTPSCHTETTLQKLGIPYRHVPEPVIRKDGERLAIRLKQFARMRKVLRRAMAEISPSTVVLALDNDPIALLVIDKSQEMGVRTILVPEGLIKPYEFEEQKTYLSDLFYAGLRRIGIYLGFVRYATGGCDRILVSGRRSLDILKGIGIDESRMTVVGQQKYDSFLKKVRSNGASPGKTGVYLYAASTRIFQEERELDLVRSLAKAATLLALRLIVKIHPRSAQTPDELHVLLGIDDRRLVEVLREGYDTYDLLRRVDAVITISSAIILEALMMDKECIAASYLAGRRRFDYDAYDAIHVINRESDVFAVMKASLTSTKSRENKVRLLEDEMFSLDGEASARTARIIEDTLL